MAFRKGNDPNRGDIAAARKAMQEVRDLNKIYCPPKDPTAPDELLLGWHILNNEQRHDKTPAQRNARKAYDAGPLAFRKHVLAVEQEWMAQRGISAVKKEMDDGTKLAVEHAEKILKSIAKEISSAT